MPVTTVFLRFLFQPDDLDFFTHLHLTALDAAGTDRTAAGDREDVFDRHEERLVDFADRLGNEVVDRIHQLEDRIGVRIAALTVGVERLERGAADDRRVVAVEFVLGQQFADFHLDQLEQLFVFDQVDLIQEHDDPRNADLAHEQNVLARLRHRAVGRRDDEDGAVHLGGTGDHVLDVVGVAGAVDVRVVALRRLVLLVRDRNRNAALFLFGRVVDLVDAAALASPSVARQCVIAAVSVVLP